jgi:hypothetical protein
MGVIWITISKFSVKANLYEIYDLNTLVFIFQFVI